MKRKMALVATFTYHKWQESRSKNPDVVCNVEDLGFLARLTAAGCGFDSRCGQQHGYLRRLTREKGSIVECFTL